MSQKQVGSNIRGYDGPLPLPVIAELNKILGETMPDSARLEKIAKRMRNYSYRFQKIDRGPKGECRLHFTLPILYKGSKVIVSVSLQKRTIAVYARCFGGTGDWSTPTEICIPEILKDLQKGLLTLRHGARPKVEAHDSTHVHHM